MDLLGEIIDSMGKNPKMTDATVNSRKPEDAEPRYPCKLRRKELAEIFGSSFSSVNDDTPIKSDKKKYILPKIKRSSTLDPASTSSGFPKMKRSSTVGSDKSEVHVIPILKRSSTVVSSPILSRKPSKQPSSTVGSKYSSSSHGNSKTTASVGRSKQTSSTVGSKIKKSRDDEIEILADLGRNRAKTAGAKGRSKMKFSIKPEDFGLSDLDIDDILKDPKDMEPSKKEDENPDKKSSEDSCAAVGSKKPKKLALEHNLDDMDQLLDSASQSSSKVVKPQLRKVPVKSSLFFNSFQDSDGSSSGRESSPAFRFAAADRLEYEAKEAERKKKPTKKSANKKPAARPASKLKSSVFDMYSGEEETKPSATARPASKLKSSVFDMYSEEEEIKPSKKKIKSSSTPKKAAELRSSVFSSSEDEKKKTKKSAKQKSTREKQKVKDRRSIARFQAYKTKVQVTPKKSTPKNKKTSPKKPERKKSKKELEKEERIRIVDEMLAKGPEPDSSMERQKFYEESRDVDLAYEARIKELRENSDRRKQEEDELERFEAENGQWRDRLEAELTKPLLEQMFQDNIQYITSIWDGSLQTSRHDSWNIGGGPRRGLMFRMITHPFSDDQLAWTTSCIHENFLPSKDQQRLNGDYVWKVALPEVFTKLYMEFFKIDEEDAVNRIWNTPLKPSDCASSNKPQKKERKFMESETSKSSGDSDSELENEQFPHELPDI